MNQIVFSPEKKIKHKIIHRVDAEWGFSLTNMEMKIRLYNKYLNIWQQEPWWHINNCWPVVRIPPVITPAGTLIVMRPTCGIHAVKSQTLSPWLHMVTHNYHYQFNNQSHCIYLCIFHWDGYASVWVCPIKLWWFVSASAAQNWEEMNIFSPAGSIIYSFLRERRRM